MEQFLKDKIINMYNNGFLIREISRQTSISKYRIGKLFRNNNIITKRGQNRKRKIDETTFETIDTDNKAYLLGLICSDGSIDNDGYGFQICSKDIEILEYAKSILNSDHSICKVSSYDTRTKKVYTRYNVHFCSKKMVNDLKKMGLTNNKSFDCVMPEFDNIYFWSFLRGLFDGDGTVNGYDGRYKISFICTENIFSKICCVFTENNINITKPSLVSTRDGLNILSLKINKYDDVLLIREKMYLNNNGFYLRRKYEKLKSLRKGFRGGSNSILHKIWKKIKAVNIDTNEEFKFKDIREFGSFLGVNRYDKMYKVLNGKKDSYKGYKFSYLD